MQEQSKTGNSYIAQYTQQFPESRNLAKIAQKSIDRLGFFSRHPPRAFEYPWVCDKIDNADGVAVDIGAGLSPMPFLLADRGMSVLTVDYSSLVRRIEDKGRWNEWGFLDYSLIDSRIKSQNADFRRANIAPNSADIVYSVSVIEHMPAEIRRGVVHKIGRILKPGGRLVLTLDLVPNTRKLWNFNRGKPVENIELHGTLDDFIEELSESKIDIKELRVMTALPGSSTDIACLVGEMRSRPSFACLSNAALSPRFYTMANNRMADSFRRFSQYFSAFMPGASLCVIPFDEECDEVATICRAASNLQLVHPDPRIDGIGKAIFGDEEYRKGIPSWRYFRKFNAFVGHQEKFAFLDANCIPLADLRALSSIESRNAILFGNRSVIDRSIKDESSRAFLSAISPALLGGYNCGLFYSQGGVVDIGLAQKIASPALRKVIGKAPEQGFLAYYMAVFGVAHGLIGDHFDDVANVTDKVSLTNSSDGYLRASPPAGGSRIQIAIKYTGQELREAPEIVKDLLKSRMGVEGDRQ